MPGFHSAVAKHKIFFPLLLLLISLVGCKVDSMNPISSLDDAQPDVALYGVWRYQAKGELTYVHIGPEFSLSISNAAAAANKRIKIILISTTSRTELLKRLMLRTDHV